jgi:flagellar protein FlaG
MRGKQMEAISNVQSPPVSMDISMKGIGQQQSSTQAGVQGVESVSVEKPATPVAKAKAEEKKEDKKDVETLKQQLGKLSNDLNKEMSPLNFNVKFGFNDKVDEMYVSVTEKSSNKLIRKIPSDEAMNLMEKMREIVGMIFDKKA